MMTTTQQMSCAAFQDQLPQLISAGEGFSSHPHYQTCELCRALLSELEIIAATARRLLPIVEPPDTVWSKLQQAIESDRASVHSV